MNTLAKAARFDDSSLWVDLSDGRIIAVPLAWFPRLINASAEQRTAPQCSSQGLHWPDIDEDISVDGLLAGVGDLTRAPRALV
jgi:hypothetical protein